MDGSSIVVNPIRQWWTAIQSLRFTAHRITPTNLFNVDVRVFHCMVVVEIILIISKNLLKYLCAVFPKFISMKNPINVKITTGVWLSSFQNKFTSLSLAFKTDKHTLGSRLELQQRQRDIAEKNIEEEIEQLKSAIGVRINRLAMKSSKISTYIFQCSLGW